jgi:hypothetical protein
MPGSIPRKVRSAEVVVASCTAVSLWLVALEHLPASLVLVVAYKIVQYHLEGQRQRNAIAMAKQVPPGISMVVSDADRRIELKSIAEGLSNPIDRLDRPHGGRSDASVPGLAPRRRPKRIQRPDVP